MSNFKLALLNIKKNFRNEKELKSSFIISVIGMAINNISFIAIWYYFGKAVGRINGWDAIDVFGLYAFAGISYGIVSSFFYGIFNIPSYITNGNFDKYLLTPKNILMKVSTSAISTSAIGDLLFGIICFVLFAFWTNLTFLQLSISILLMILASIVFYSVILVCMSVSFYLMDGHNVSQGLSGMAVGTSMYHGGAFTGVLRIIFTYVMPSLLLGAVPVEIIKNMSLSNLFLMIALTIFWFVFSIVFFYKSLKKYESNNLFGFGN